MLTDDELKQLEAKSYNLQCKDCHIVSELVKAMREQRTLHNAAMMELAFELAKAKHLLLAPSRDYSFEKQHKHNNIPDDECCWICEEYEKAKLLQTELNNLEKTLEK